MARQRRSPTLSKEVKSSFLKPSFLIPFQICSMEFTRGIGRNVKKDNIFRDVQHFRFMPGSAVTAKQNDIVREWEACCRRVSGEA